MYVGSGLVLKMNSTTVKPLDQADKHGADGLKRNLQGSVFFII